MIITVELFPHPICGVADTQHKYIKYGVQMKKYIFLISLVLILASSLYCELDFQHIDTFPECYTPPVPAKSLVKNNDRFLLITSYGVEIY